MQEIRFYFDDSGVLTKNEKSGYFVYAGYVFYDLQKLDEAKRKYISLNKKLKKALNRNDELKASTLHNNIKRALYNVLKNYDSVSISVKINKIYESIINDKKSICRYKDYVMKMCIKRALEKMILDNKISNKEDTQIRVYIDEQPTASNGYYDLKNSIKEELQHDMINLDHFTIHNKVFKYNSNVTVEIYYCDSRKNYIIQASDILANKIWHLCSENIEKIGEIPNHMHLTFPR